MPEKLPADAVGAMTALQDSMSSRTDLILEAPEEASDSPVALWSAFGKKAGHLSTLTEQPVQPPSTLSSADPRVDRPAHDRTTSHASAAAALAAASIAHEPVVAAAGGGGWSIPASYGTVATRGSSSAGGSPAGGDAGNTGSWTQDFPGFPTGSGLQGGQQPPPPPRARHVRSISTPTALTLGDPFDVTWPGMGASPQPTAEASPADPSLQSVAAALQRPGGLLLHHLSADSGLLLELAGAARLHSRLPSSTATFHSRGSSANTHSRAASVAGLPLPVVATPPRRTARVAAAEVQSHPISGTLAAPWSSGSSSGGLGSDSTAAASAGIEPGVLHSRGDSQQTVESLDGPGMDALRASSGGLDAQLAALGLGDETASGDCEPSALERLYLSSGGFGTATAAAIKGSLGVASSVGGSPPFVSPQRSPIQALSAAADGVAPLDGVGMPVHGSVTFSDALPPTRLKRALPPGHARSVSVPNIDLGAAVLGEGEDAGAAAELASQDWPDLTTEPSRHMWVGNLTTKLHRSALKALFEAHAGVEDVVTFPGRMYAFVNFRSVEDAIRAHEALEGQEAHELTCGRKLVLKFRPSKKAIGRVRGDSAHAALAADYTQTEPLVQSDWGASTSPSDNAVASDVGDGSSAAAAAAAAGKAVGEWEGSSTPSPRVWLGNLTAGVTSKTLRTVFAPYGAVADAAVFPGRIGPLGYAFVNFEEVEAAIAAFDALNNTVAPLLTGSKQLKMRFKPVKDYEEGKAAAAVAAASAAAGTGADAGEFENEEGLNTAGDPSQLDNAPTSAAQGARSRHLWLGNLVAKPGKPAIEEAFAKFGKLAGARVFPGKTYAFVNFDDVEAADAALQSMDGAVVQSLTGGKPLVVRYQLDPDARDKKRSTSGGTCAVAPGEDPSGLFAAAAVAAAAAALNGGLSISGSTGMGGSASAPASAAHSRNASALGGGVMDESVFPTLNLSNRLNPNNTHYDHNLATRYKRMSKAEKEQLWAQDRVLQEQLRQLHKAAQSTPGGLSAALGNVPGAVLGGVGLGGAMGGSGLDLGSLLGSPLAMQLLGLGGGLGGGLSNNIIAQLAASLSGPGLGGLAPLLAPQQQQQPSLLGLLQQPAGGFGLMGGTSTDQMLLAAAAALQQQQAATAALLGNASHSRSVSLDQLQLGQGQDPVALATLLVQQQQQQQMPFSMPQHPPQSQHMKWDADASSGHGGAYPSVPPGLGHSPNASNAGNNAGRGSISIEALANAPAAAVQQLAVSGGFPGGSIDAQGLFAGFGGNSILGSQFAGASAWPASSLGDFSNLLQQQPQQLQTSDSNAGYQ